MKKTPTPPTLRHHHRTTYSHRQSFLIAQRRHAGVRSLSSRDGAKKEEGMAHEAEVSVITRFMDASLII